MHRNRILRTVIFAAFAIPAGGGAQARLTSAQTTTWAKLLQMADGRRLDTTLVRTALNSGLPSLRAEAVLAIGQVGKGAGTPGIPILRSSLADKDEHVASNAAYALGLLGDSGSVGQLRALLNGRTQVGINAAWALGTIGTASRSAILSALSDQSIQPDVKVQILLASAKLRPLPVAELRPYLASKRPSFIWAATYAISRPRAVPGARDMINVASNPTVAASCTNCNPSNSAVPYTSDVLARHRARADAARMLIKTVTSDSLSSAAIPVLRVLTKDPQPHVRINAFRSLATFGSSVKNDVLAGLGDRDPNVRVATAQVVGGVLDSAEVTWSALWNRDTSYMYRTSLAASAAASGVLLPALSGWETSTDWRYRASLVSAIGSLPNRPSPDARILRLTNDTDPRVREASVSSLVSRDTLKMTPAIRAVLIRALSDENIVVRTTALDALTATASVSDLDAVLASYERARGDAESDARISAVQYLSSLWKRDSLNFPAAARARISALGPPTDPLERRAAGTQTLFAAWPAVLPQPRDLSWYSEIVNRLIVPSLRGKPPVITLNTVRGPIVLELFAVDAPLTVNNIIALASRGYYTGTRFHRVVPNFVAQDGDPTGTGSGGPGYAIRDETNPHRYERGSLGMALSGADTGGSQYFITHSPQPHLDGGYTVFGHVISGWSALDAIVQGDLIKTVTVRK
jgi:cyclophilin family peptidyl-prolyl cis-trans isomerase/HEAT repeat protein